MLAPLLAVCELRLDVVWRTASAIIAIELLVHTWSILKRFKANRPGPFPRRVWVNSTITGMIVLALIANAVPLYLHPRAEPVAVAASWRLVMAVEIFMLTLEEFLAIPSRKKA